jgi:enoyl-CoA hydratase
MNIPTLETIEISAAAGVAEVRLNRPDKANALNLTGWLDIRRAFEWVDAEPAVRVAVLSGNGKHFCSGIDIGMLAGIADQVDDDCEGRKREKLRRVILDLQDTLTSLERCRKPVIAAIQGACVGGAIDLICAADVRMASADARFSIKEIDMGMTADVGTLQRMPKLMPPGIVRELAFTGRDFSAEEAARWGFVNRVCVDRDALLNEARALATTVAAKSPLAMRGIKEQLNFARDHSVAEGLNYIATWNAAMLMSSDLNEAVMSAMQGKTAKFRD